MDSEEKRKNCSVLHIGAGRYEMGSDSHSTFSIWRELAKGFHNYTVVGRSRGHDGGRFTAHGVDVRLFASCMAREAEFLLSQFNAVQIADEVAADVVVSQCPVLGGLAATRIRRRRRTRTLLEFHSSFYFEEHPALSRYGIIKSLTQWNLPNADRIRVLSEGMRSRLLQTFGTAYAPRIVVLPPRVDLSIFSSARKSYKITARPVVVIVGTVCERKGQKRFLNAVLPKIKDLEIRVIGSGPDLPVCQKIVARHHAADRVTFMGSLNHTQLAAVLPAADALILFSNIEGTPRVIIEAMAVGLPVVTTNAGFSSDLVRNGIDGFVLGEDPANEIVSRLHSLFSDERLRQQMGQSARQRAQDEFDSVKVFARYRSLIYETAQL